MINIFESVGFLVLNLLNETGRIVFFLLDSVKMTLKPPFRMNLLLKQIEFIGIKSLSVVILTGTFTGMVFAFQSYIGFHKFGAEHLVGTVVSLGMARELGPVLSSIMVTARAGSAITAEIGTMRVTEQIDALEALSVDPIQYLVTPRILAGIIVLPLLDIVSVFFGIGGGYLVSVGLLDINKTLYLQGIYDFVEMGDLFNGMIKATVFGFILTLIGSYKGYYTKGGAEGVGKATTGSVVLSCVLILIFDYILTALMF
jgi:phospholipid/cholesterol/gamma-HCH transport system permease protein